MSRWPLWILIAALGAAIFPARGQTNDIPLPQKRWYEVRTAHFNIYGCGPLRDVYKLAGRLEQFCDAYSLLAGTNAVASPPIVVMAFPDHASLKPFLPLYHGSPANLAGFFTRGRDENLIVLALPGANPADSSMGVIFHEYAHLLFRRNDRIWPLWLKEGMAEVYSTFVTADGVVQIARPMRHHLHLLAHTRWMPLSELFAVTPKSPQYNERSRQGIFYAESWLLTDYLMAGDNPVLRKRFGKFTDLLRDGQRSEQAFTNALEITLPAMEVELWGYLKRGYFEPISLALPKGLASAVDVKTRVITPVEVCFHLGDELLRIDRLNDAESYFAKAKKLAPGSPLPYEGLGLVAAQRGEHERAVRDLAKALHLGSTSFLVYYAYAQEKYRLTADAQGRYQPLKGKAATEIRKELETSIRLMPHFAPAHGLLGFFEMVQGRNLAAAERQLRLAIQLEPENPAYLFTLAQLQLRDRDPNAARRTLQSLLLPNVDARLRESAEELIQKISKQSR